MKFIERHLNFIGIFLLISFAATAAGLCWDVPERVRHAVRTKEPAGQYVCPMHKQVVRNAPDQCPECGMRLVKSSTAESAEPSAAQGGCCASSAHAESALPAGPTCSHMAALTNSSPCPAHTHP